MKVPLMIAWCTAVTFFTTELYGQKTLDNEKTIFAQIDGAKKFQQIDGVGVNINTRSWDGEKLKPALNLLIDSMRASLFRVVVETVYNWEAENDNADPFEFNWDYYNSLYSTPKFQKAWSTIAYLNRRGIAEKLMIDFMGPIPLWMGGKFVTEKFEDEYIEMLVSFFYFARKVKHLEVGMVSIMNEPDMENEGPTVSPKQYRILLRKFIDRMNDLGMGDVKIVAPDVASMDNGIHKYLPELMKDSVVMSKIAKIGFYSYGGYYSDVDSFLVHSSYPLLNYWLTEWNNWCEGCDNGIIGEYNYSFAEKSVEYLLDFVLHGATGAISWEGYDSYYEHHAPSTFSYWGLLGYDTLTKAYLPRKNFYAIQQVSKFIGKGNRRISITPSSDSTVMTAFYDSVLQLFKIIGINKNHRPINLKCAISNLPVTSHLVCYYTDSVENLHDAGTVEVKGKNFVAHIPANSIFALNSVPSNIVNMTDVSSRPEPHDWYSGDIHVHLNCGEGTLQLPENVLAQMMEPNNLSVISLLADMGNGEVKYAKTDLKKVNGMDAPQSKPGRILHWDTEWHWDAVYSNFAHQALGGHLVLLGLKNARQMWEESPYKILEWGRNQHAVNGFAHMEYLSGDSIQNDLNCCIPIDYPVEAALGLIDFVSEDVYTDVNEKIGSYYSEGGVKSYYKLLNCGFRLALAAGTDFPCNDNEPLGTLLTYVKVKDVLTYDKWVEGIRKGATVISRNGHNEFLEMKVNNICGPGDEINLAHKDVVKIQMNWTSLKNLTGRIELVSNGKVIGSFSGVSKPGVSLVVDTSIEISKSSWICARRMDDNGHKLHTSPVYITVNKKPIRASAEDAKFFVQWIDNTLKNIEPGKPWNRYFPNDYPAVKERYEKAKQVYEKIALECGKN